jgi:hypothetical protein
VLVELGLAERDGDMLSLVPASGRCDPAASSTYARAEARRRDALERIARAAPRQSRAPAASTM